MENSEEAPNDKTGEKGDSESQDKFSVPLVLKSGKHLPYGMFDPPVYGYNFFDASIGLLDFGVNSVELDWLDKINSIHQECDTKYLKSLDDIAREIVSQETNLNLNDYDVYTNATGARGAIISLVGALASEKKPRVAYGSPNWKFDEFFSCLTGLQGVPFFAPSAERFVEGFEKLDDLDKISTLIIVDPANPLGYRFSQEHVKKIEEIAEKHGIVPIFDDVFRGLQEQGKRNSASQYSKSSVIVETTSKRFGIRGLGVTWTLNPKHLHVPEIKNILVHECEGCSSIAAIVTDALNSTRYEERVRSFLIGNSEAFRRGFEDPTRNVENCGKFVEAFPGMPIMTYFIPSGTDQKEQLGMVFSLANIIRITTGYEWICDGTKDNKIKVSKEEIDFAGKYIRICPTKESAGRSYVAGKILGFNIADFLRKKD